MLRILTAAFAVCIAAPAMAQGGNCGPRDNVTDVLSNKYGESVLTRAIMANQLILEFWGNAESETWTVVTTSSDGISCVQASGTGFERLEPQASGARL